MLNFYLAHKAIKSVSYDEQPDFTVLCSHLGDRLQSEDAEALLEDLRRGVAENDTPHVDLDDLAGFLVPLDAVARVVELGEGRGHLVHELAESVQAEVVGDLQNDLCEAAQQFSQLELLLVLESHRGRLPG